MDTVKTQNIDEYIARFPAEVQETLGQIRAAIQQAVPQATEAISYAMPTFKLNGNLIHFAAYKNHIGLYPAPRSANEFKEELSAYKGTKGSVHFPLNKPMPLNLIARIAIFRAQAMQQTSLAKK
jgi:uncharacterized protein YdhG (YjbR/CyaY superfamily)